MLRGSDPLSRVDGAECVDLRWTAGGETVQHGVLWFLLAAIPWLLYFIAPDLQTWGFGTGLALLGAGLGLLASQVGNVIMSSVSSDRSSEAAFDKMHKGEVLRSVVVF